MNPTVSRNSNARIIPSGWSLALFLLAALALFTPGAFAATLTANLTDGTPHPGETLEVTGTYILDDGETFVSSNWSQVTDEGLPVEEISNPDNASDTGSHVTNVTLGSANAYAAHLIQLLKKPPITEDDLPPDLVLQPLNEREKGLQDRNQVVAINPLAYEKTEEIGLVFTVVTSNGTYKAEVKDPLTDPTIVPPPTLIAHLPWVVNTGVRTVPVDVPVMLLAKCGEEFNETTEEYECQDQTAFSWTITGPECLDGSEVVLMGADTRSPWFTPCRTTPTYPFLVEETNGSGASLEVHAGSYHGVIDPLLTLDSVDSGDGRPVADPNCTGCHTEGGAAPPNFDTWRLTGHAEAFTQGITTNSHFGERCFACHAVGFDRGGIDSTPSYADFMTALDDAQHGGDISTLWETMLIEMPDTARLSNIQCENCHGPQNYTAAHKDMPGEPRVSLSSDVCGSCHGEPARHGRFQQWQLSNHADYELASERGTREDCARCHSGNGFIAWDKHDFDPSTTLAGEVTWDADTVVPQTCAACHNPHDTGTTSGTDGTDAKVRVMGDTHLLVAGFTAETVGKGATCMTCHNSRRGLRNDQVWDSLSDSEKTGGPHHGVQADLIMGQNAYFFTQNELTRGKHSLIEDTCVTCHMNATQPPDILSYNQAGTNHTFAADPGICVECHGAAGETLADTVSEIVNGYLGDLEEQMGDAWMRLMTANYPVTIGGACGTADVGGKGKNAVNNPIESVEWVFSRGTRLNVTVGGVTCSNLNPSSILVGKVFNNADKNTTLLSLSLQPGNDVLWKAMWNYGMLEEDSDPTGSTHRGVHNPDFSMAALERAINAVEALNP
jgi:hypothetical protein